MTADLPQTPVEALLAEREWVRALARSLVDDVNQADEIEQQTWLAAAARPPRDLKTPRAWLGTVMRNFVRLGARRDGRRRIREAAASHSESMPSAAEMVARAETHRRVVDAVLALPEPNRAAILARFFEEMPPREIARRLGVPVETVRTRIKRGLAELRAQLDAQFGGDGKSWGIALVPLAWKGGVIVKGTTKAGIAVVLVAGGIGVAVMASRGTPTSDAPGEIDAPQQTASVIATRAAQRAVRTPDVAPPIAGPADEPVPVVEERDRTHAETTVRVTDVAGNPIAGARIDVRERPTTGSWAETPVALVAATDERGEATFRQQRGTTWIAEVTTPSHLPQRTGLLAPGSTTSLVLVGGARLRLELEPVGGGTIVGPKTVFVFTRPVAGGVGPGYDCTVDENTLDLMVPQTGDPIAVLVSVDGFVSADWRHAPWGPSELTEKLYLERARTMRGVVVDGRTSEPIADVKLRVAGDPSGTTSAQDGTFELSIPAHPGEQWMLRLVATHPQFAIGRQTIADLGSSTAEVRMQAGNELRVVPAMQDGSQLPASTTVTYWYGVNGTARYQATPRIESGEFIIRVNAGELVCGVVTADGIAPAPFAAASDSAGADRLEIVMKPSVAVSGRLVFPTRKPIANRSCTVSLVKSTATFTRKALANSGQGAGAATALAASWTARPTFREGETWVTDASGRFEFNVPPGLHWIEVNDPQGSRPIAIPFEVPEARSKFDVGAIIVPR